MNITAIPIDLAKDVLQVLGIDDARQDGLDGTARRDRGTGIQGTQQSSIVWTRRARRYARV